MLDKTYTVKYRLPGRWRWVTVEGVVGDGIYTDQPMRFFQKADETLVIVPLVCEVIFSKDRAIAIERKMSKEAGQPVQRA